MTLLPVDSQDITAVEGPEYKVNARCSTPFCDKYSDHAHHIVRRSFIGGDVSWVRFPDDRVFANKTGLCWLHHKDVTENRTRIVYDDTDQIFYWDNYVGYPVSLTYQPYTPENVPLDPDHPEHGPVGLPLEKQVCETCGRPLPKPKIEKDSEEKKPRKTWAVAVPADKLEDGAEALDTLVEAARDILDQHGISYGAGKNVKYYPLSTSLALFVTHADQIFSDK